MSTTDPASPEHRRASLMREANAAPAERTSSGAETRTSEAGAAPSAIDYPGVTAGKDEHDRAREREEAEWGFPMPLADDAPIDWKIALRARDERIAALAIERGYLRRALERIAADLGLDEESFPVPTDAGEIVSFRQVIRGRIADLAQKRGEAQDGYKHFTFDPPVRIGEAKEMPPWPAPIVTSDDKNKRLAALEAELAEAKANLKKWPSLECPCCGNEAAFATFFEDGQATICGCGGTVMADGEDAYVYVDGCAKNCEDEPSPVAEKSGALSVGDLSTQCGRCGHPASYHSELGHMCGWGGTSPTCSCRKTVREIVRRTGP